MYNLLEKLCIQVEGMQTEINDIRSNMATKEDLSNFATKEDLSNFATKEDLSNFATKDDLSNFATKDDLKNLATKDDIDLLGNELHAEVQAVYEELTELRNDFNTMQVLTTKNAYDIAKFKIAR